MRIISFDGPKTGKLAGGRDLLSSPIIDLRHVCIMIRTPPPSCPYDELCDWLAANAVCFLIRYGLWKIIEDNRPMCKSTTTNSRKCAKQQVLIQLWLAQPSSDSGNINKLQHDGEYTVTANESDNQY